MDTVRDLGEIDLWEESLQRSLARRHTPREVRTRRPVMPMVGLGGASTVALLAAMLPGLLGGKSASAHADRLAYIAHGAGSARMTAGESGPSARPELRRLPPRLPIEHRAPTAHRLASTPHTTTAPSRPVVTRKPTPAPRPATVKPAASAPAKPPAIVAAALDIPKSAATPASHAASSGYVNPLAHASVTPERIDQGVDYGGTGPLAAIGAGRITYVGTSNTGWPGAFIEFQLSAGRYAGRYVFYAEGIVPAHGLHVGQRVRAGQTVATLTGSSGGIEIGWGAGIGTETYAMKVGQWQSGMDEGNSPTPAGKSFSSLIASLGGPPGKIEG